MMIDSLPSHAGTAHSAVEATVNDVPGYFLGKHPDAKPADIPAILAKYTQGQCRQASTHSLYRLNSQHNELFDRLFLLSTDTSHGPLNNPRYGEHSYFVASTRTQPRVWFAASPANYEPGPLNPMTTIFQATDLNDILTSIKQRDGGVWPSSETILELLTGKYEPPFLSEDKEYISATQILMAYPKPVMHRKTAVFLPNYPTY